MDETRLKTAISSAESDEMTPSHDSRRRVITYGLFGFSYAVVTTFMAWLLTGAGHGWGSASNCWLGIFVVPLLGVAWALRNTWTSHLLLSLVILGMLFIYGLILWKTADKGWSYAKSVFRHIPMIAIPWLIAWVGWQYFAVRFLYRRMILRRSLSSNADGWTRRA